jgi:hypothetical protein
MKRTIALFVLILLTAAVVSGQETTPSENAATAFVVRVVVDSAFVRALPDIESEMVGSVFENDLLYAIGRSADGRWLEVHRPGNTVNTGWISKPLISFTFAVAQLPLTDLETGVTGPEPVYDSGVSMLVLTEAALRDYPSLNGRQIGILPVDVTIPAFERSPDNLWLHVNYLGNTGWVAEFLVRTTNDVTRLPVDPSLGVTTVPLEIIPVEVQIAQAQRLIDYAQPIYDLASTTATFWGDLSDSKTVRCDPPPGGLAYFGYTQRDIVELPELRQQVRRVPRAIDDLNASLEAMQRCGIYTPLEISTAYAQAINARAILSAVIGRMQMVIATLSG